MKIKDAGIRRQRLVAQFQDAIQRRSERHLPADQTLSEIINQHA
jgi:hypothetical protein